VGRDCRTELLQRGPSGPRLLVRLAIVVALTLPLGSCGHFGPGLAELPAEQGWQVMPVSKWVIDDAIRPQTVVFCPPDACPSPAMVAVFKASGQEASRLEQLIGQNPAQMLQNISRPPLRPRLSGKPDKPTHPGSTTTVEKLGDGLTGARITLRSKAADGRMASGVVLVKRDGTSLAIALAVTTDPDKALAHAKSGLASVW
jgi:hypothetical protein